MFVINKAASLANVLILRVDFLVSGKLAAIICLHKLQITKVGVYLESRIR